MSWASREPPELVWLTTSYRQFASRQVQQPVILCHDMSQVILCYVMICHKLCCVMSSLCQVTVCNMMSCCRWCIKWGAVLATLCPSWEWGNALHTVIWLWWWIWSMMLWCQVPVPQVPQLWPVSELLLHWSLHQGTQTKTPGSGVLLSLHQVSGLSYWPLFSI